MRKIALAICFLMVFSLLSLSSQPAVSAQGKIILHQGQSYETTANDFRVKWTMTYEGPARLEYDIEVQNLAGQNRRISLDTLFSDTSFDISQLNVKFYEWKAIPTPIEVSDYDWVAGNRVLENATLVDNLFIETENVTFEEMALAMPYFYGSENGPNYSILWVKNFSNIGVGYENLVKLGDNKYLIEFTAWEVVGSHPENRMKCDWKPCKMQWFKRTSSTYKESMGEILIPALGSKAKYDDYDDVETENGIKKFRIEFDVPITETPKGWGSSGKVAILLDNTEFHPWWNSNWSHRKKATTSSLNNDVFSTVDYDSDMQPDFDDIRFTESEDLGELTYWIEYSEEGVSANVWIKREGPTDYEFWMYYGNSSASSASLTWTGKIILGAKSVPAGWTQETDVLDKFLRCSATYGGVGGSSSHTHTYSGSVSAGWNTYAARQAPTSTIHITTKYTHSHSFSGTTGSSSSHIPFYFNMIFVSKQGHIPMSVGTPFNIFLKSLPGGWVQNTNYGYYVRGGEYGGTGGSSTHAHSVSGTTGQPGKDGYYCRTGETTYNSATGRHTHSYSGTSDGENNDPSYFDVIVASPPSLDDLPDGMLPLFTSLPPLGWVNVSDANGRLIRIGSSYGEIGGRETHAHSFSMVSGGPSETQTSGGNNWYVPSTTHKHTISGTTSEVSTMPPYLNVILGQRLSSPGVTWGGEESQPNSPTSLLCEGQANPTQITNTTPVFSAIGTDNDGDQMNYCALQVDDDPSFGTPIWNKTKTPITAFNSGERCANISYDGPPLTRNTTYYWRIKFWDVVGGKGDWSTETATFKINQLPTTTNVDVQGTQNIQHITDHTPDITWSYSDDDGDAQSHYQAQIWTGTGGTGTKKEDSGEVVSASTTYTCTADNLVDGETYYVRVRTKDGLEWGSYAEVQFRMNTPPNKPYNILPSGRVGFHLIPIILEADVIDNEGDSMTVCFYDNSDGSLIDNDASVPSGGTGSVEWTGLTEGATYSFYVRAYDGYEWGENSIVQTLTVNYEPVVENLTAENLRGDVVEGTSFDLYVDISDADGDNCDVTFYNSANDAVIGAVENIPSGENAMVVWDELEPWETFSFYVIANDGYDTVRSSGCTIHTDLGCRYTVYIRYEDNFGMFPDPKGTENSIENRNIYVIFHYRNYEDREYQVTENPENFETNHYPDWLKVRFGAGSENEYSRTYIVSKDARYENFDVIGVRDEDLPNLSLYTIELNPEMGVSQFETWGPPTGVIGIYKFNGYQRYYVHKQYWSGTNDAAIWLKFGYDYDMYIEGVDTGGVDYGFITADTVYTKVLYPTRLGMYDVPPTIEPLASQIAWSYWVDPYGNLVVKYQDNMGGTNWVLIEVIDASEEYDIIWYDNHDETPNDFEATCNVVDENRFYDIRLTIDHDNYGFSPFYASGLVGWEGDLPEYEGGNPGDAFGYLGNLPTAFSAMAAFGVAIVVMAAFGPAVAGLGIIMAGLVLGFLKVMGIALAIPWAVIAFVVIIGVLAQIMRGRGR